jgi:hypothetical protein
MRRRRYHPALLETAIDDGALDRLDTDRVFIDAENAGTLARSRADTTSELGEVARNLVRTLAVRWEVVCNLLGHEQAVQCVAPLTLENLVKS